MTARPPTTTAHPEGLRPDPSTLPRPKLFSAPPPGQQARGYTTAPDLTREAEGQNVPVAMTSVALMLAGSILIALGVIFWSWPYAAAGGAVGAVGVVVGWRARLLEEYREGESPTATS